MKNIDWYQCFSFWIIINRLIYFWILITVAWNISKQRCCYTWITFYLVHLTAWLVAILGVFFSIWLTPSFWLSVADFEFGLAPLSFVGTITSFIWLKSGGTLFLFEAAGTIGKAVSSMISHGSFEVGWTKPSGGVEGFGMAVGSLFVERSSEEATDGISRGGDLKSFFDWA